jgi:hypothetical protein
MQVLNVFHGFEDSVDNAKRHRLQDMLIERIRAKVILITVSAPQVAVVGRHKHVPRHLTQTAFMQLVDDLTKDSLFIFDTQVRKKTSTAKNSNSLV